MRLRTLRNSNAMALVKEIKENGYRTFIKKILISFATMEFFSVNIENNSIYDNEEHIIKNKEIYQKSCLFSAYEHLPPGRELVASNT